MTPRRLPQRAPRRPPPRGTHAHTWTRSGVRARTRWSPERPKQVHWGTGITRVLAHPHPHVSTGKSLDGDLPPRGGHAQIAPMWTVPPPAQDVVVLLKHLTSFIALGDPELLAAAATAIGADTLRPFFRRQAGPRGAMTTGSRSPTRSHRGSTRSHRSTGHNYSVVLKGRTMRRSCGYKRQNWLICTRRLNPQDARSWRCGTKRRQLPQPLQRRLYVLLSMLSKQRRQPYVMR